MTLKIQMVSLLLGIFFAYATALSVPETATTDGFSQKIQSGVHKLDTHFMKLLYNSTGPEENVFYSPLNIYTALSSLLLGASGATKSELISSLLELSQSDDLQSLQIHETLGKILDSIQHSQLANVSVGNGIFPQKGLKIKDNYQQSSKKYYKSEALPVDFAQGGNEATDIVNKWISDKTNNRIPKLFEGPISSTTRLLLASTIYFSATWQNKFPEGSTKLEKFNTGIKEVNVHTMNAKKTIPYINNPALQFEAISLPYLKNEFAMLITLPYANHSLIKLVNSLTPETYQNLIKEISPIRTYVDYKVPRLKFKWSQSINKIIKDLGAKKIFSDAELDKLIEGEHVSVSDVTHAAEIEVDEEGTVATAVTVIQFVKSSLMQINIEEPIKFYVNRPFLLSIYHPETGVILFTGLVQNPAAD